MGVEADAMAKVMISVPDALLEEIDRAAKAEHRSRSEFVREATRDYLARPRPARRPIDDPEVRAAIADMDRLAQQMRNPNWSGAKEIRKWRDRDRLSRRRGG
jgi:Arc/MetJ-type ribon-helix-helix transcriptional regulator